MFAWSKALIDRFFGRDTEYESLFKQYVNDKFGSSIHMRYNYRNGTYEDISNVFITTNEQEKEMLDYFKPIFSPYIETKNVSSYDNMCLRIAEWVNKHAIYVDDKTRYAKEEYWASPYELFTQIRDTGKFSDDCDGYAVLIVYIWKLMGIPSYRRFVRAGTVYYTNGQFAGGHATPIYLPYSDPVNYYPLEGSFYADMTNKKFLVTPLSMNKTYGDTWFICNEDNSYKGDAYNAR